MNIRTFEPGDEAAQVSIYNEAAADLPKFKPASLDEVRRRCRAADFDPRDRLFALDEGRPVGYVACHANGRVSYPWCRKGHEAMAEPLFKHALQAMKERGLAHVFAAYRGDWPRPRDFFLAQGFTQAREMLNFVLDVTDMPTPSARPNPAIGPLHVEDVPAVLGMVPEMSRCRTVESLEKHLFHNPYFPPEAVFAVRQRGDKAPLAVAVLVVHPGYADPRQVDASMPCFRLGAFGAEGMQVKRINGLFSFLVRPGQNMNPLGLDLLGYAALRLQDVDVESFAAQVPSDAGALPRFYQQFFRRQGNFPVYERAL